MKGEIKKTVIQPFVSSSSERKLYWLGGLVSMLLLAYCIGTFLIFEVIGTPLGPPPENIKECFSILNENKFYGLLRLDILTVFAMPLYYLLFYSIYLALKNLNREFVTIALILTYIGLTLFLSSSHTLSYLNLSNRYACAVTDAEKNQLLSAGEALFSSDMWHGTSAYLGGLLLQTGALLFSIAMVRNSVFSKLIAYTGIFIFGLDLVHILIAYFMPDLSNILMVIAGTFYLLWFPLVGFRLFKLSKI